MRNKALKAFELLVQDAFNPAPAACCARHLVPTLNGQVMGLCQVAGDEIPAGQHMAQGPQLQMQLSLMTLQVLFLCRPGSTIETAASSKLQQALPLIASLGPL